MTVLPSLFPFLSLILGAAALLVTLLLFVKTRRLTRRLEGLVAQSGGESIEETLLDHYDRFKVFEKAFRALTARHKETSATALRSIHNIGMVRFNPFPGEIGGDQSFSLALLNGSHTGLVMTALHSREGTRIYAKPIIGGISDYNLSREEQRAIEEALTNE